jgi:hypothetical protein
MTKQELMKQFEAAVDDAIRTEMYGVVEVSFKAGVPEMFRTEKTIKLNGGNEQSRAKSYR